MRSTLPKCKMIYVTKREAIKFDITVYITIQSNPLQDNAIVGVGTDRGPARSFARVGHCFWTQACLSSEAAQLLSTYLRTVATSHVHNHDAVLSSDTAAQHSTIVCPTMQRGSSLHQPISGRIRRVNSRQHPSESERISITAHKFSYTHWSTSRESYSIVCSVEWWAKLAAVAIWRMMMMVMVTTVMVVVSDLQTWEWCFADTVKLTSLEMTELSELCTFVKYSQCSHPLKNCPAKDRNRDRSQAIFQGPGPIGSVRTPVQHTETTSNRDK